MQLARWRAGGGQGLMRERGEVKERKDGGFHYATCAPRQ